MDSFYLEGSFMIIKSPIIPVDAPITNHLYGLYFFNNAMYDVNDAIRIIYQNRVFII